MTDQYLGEIRLFATRVAAAIPLSQGTNVHTQFNYA